MTSRRRPRKATAALPLLLALVLSACASSAGSSLTGGGSPTATESAPAPDPTAEETPTDAASLDDHEQALADLARARQDWAAVDPGDYVYELTRSCFCPPGVGGPWTVQVEGGAVTAVVDADGQAVPLEGGVVDFGPIPAVHDAIGEMLDSDRASTTPSGGYDDDGLPVGLYVDPNPQMADEEATFTVRLVERLPAPTTPTTAPAPGSGTAAPSPATDPAAGGWATLEPLSEGAFLATGQPGDPAGAYTATPQCGPTDAVLGYEVVGRFPTTETLDDAVERLSAAGMEAVRGEDDVFARGTTQVGAPVTIHIQDEEALVVIDLEHLPEGSEVPIEGPCG